MTESRLCWSIPEYHMGVPSWGGGSRSWSVAETVPLEGTSWKHHALEAAGRSQVGRNYVASPASLFFCRSTALRPRALRPQLKRDPLGCTDPSGVAHMRAITGIAVAIVLVRSACAQSHLDTVPFVGCPADGQQGYIAPPNAQPKVVRLHDVALQGIAYYKGDDAPGVFAPSGWHCRAWYGSSGTHLLVTAAPIDTAHFMPPKVLGPAVEMSVSSAG